MKEIIKDKHSLTMAINQTKEVIISVTKSSSEPGIKFLLNL